MQDVYPQFRTVVDVGGAVRVTGTLPGTRWRPVGAIAIDGEVRVLWRDQASELADALRLVVVQMDAVADERYGATGRVRAGRAQR